MQPFPHHYQASARSRDIYVYLASPGLPDLETAAPADFDGPGDRWSPETMLVGTIANCFILTFRAVAAASKFDWQDISCEVEAELDRIDRVTRFTRAKLKVTLKISDEAKSEQAERILQKSEENCLITNSMTTEVSMETEITTA